MTNFASLPRAGPEKVTRADLSEMHIISRVESGRFLYEILLRYVRVADNSL